MRPLAFLAIASLAFFASCETFVAADGSKHRMNFPLHDRARASDMDTNRFLRRPFTINDLDNGVSMHGNKHLVEPIDGADLRALVATGRSYLVYFWNPVCPGTLRDIHRLDSMARNGEQVIIIGERKTYDRIDAVLSHTTFSRLPYFVIENEKYSRSLARRQIEVMQEACPECYSQYRDMLMLSYVFRIDHGQITPVMENLFK